MEARLYGLGRWCFRHRRLVTLLWCLLLMAFGVGAATLSGPTRDSFSVPGTESQRAIDLLEKRFPQAAAGGGTARVAVAAPAGRSLAEPAARAAVAQAAARAGAAPHVAEAADPFAAGTVSADGRVALLEVAYRIPGADLSEADRRALVSALAPARAAGLTVEMGGDAASRPEEGAAELVGVPVAAVVLFATLGSLAAAGLPLLAAAIGVAIGLLGVTAASGFLDLNADTAALALMLGLAVGIDYALFIIFRHRQERAAGGTLEEAAGRAVGTAGSAVVVAGLTVVIALAGLAVVGIPILTQTGLAAALTVAVAVAVALTLLPALLGFAGDRVLPRRRASVRTPAADERGPGGNGLAVRWARLVTRHRIPVLIAAVAVLATAAVPVLDLRLGFPDEGTAPPGTTQRKAYDLLADGFGPGFNGPLTLVVQAPPGTAAGTAARDVTAAIGGLPGVTRVGPAAVSGDTALLRVVPATAPTSEATERLIERIRSEARGLRAGNGTSVAVTGQTALDIDTSAKLAGALPPYAALISGLALLLLMLAFRSVLIPLTATAGFLLSVAATFGAVVAVFQWGWLAGPLGLHPSGIIVNLLPVMMIGMVFGLAMDYQVFLVSRMREEYRDGAAPARAVIAGLGHSGRVVTAAALIMISVFAGFMFSATPMIRSFGFALAAAVFFDAFLVRMTIVPALLALLGRAAWWAPGRRPRPVPEAERVPPEGARS